MASPSSDDPFADPFAEESPDLDFVSVASGSSLDYEGSSTLHDPNAFTSSQMEEAYPEDGGITYVSVGGEATAEELAAAEVERPNSLSELPRQRSAAPAIPNMMNQAMGAVSGAMYGQAAAAAGGAAGAKYLPKRKSRSLWENAMHTTGTLYLTAGSAGMAVGMVTGVRSAKNFRPRILLNSVLNSCGRTGSRLGNSAAAIGMFYTGFTYALDAAEFDGIPSRLGLRRQDVYTPMAAIALSLLLFRSPRMVSGAPAQRIGAALTPVLGAAAIAGVAAMAPLLGANAPFRWN
jgi:hypothetical protein